MLREDMDKKLRELEEITEKCEKLEKEMRHSEEKHKRTELELIKEKGVWESKASELESDLNVRIISVIENDLYSCECHH